MKWTDENMQETYRTLDMDSSGVLEKQRLVNVKWFPYHGKDEKASPTKGTP